jgi:hypothetical protein
MYEKFHGTLLWNTCSAAEEKRVITFPETNSLDAFSRILQNEM